MPRRTDRRATERRRDGTAQAHGKSHRLQPNRLHHVRHGPDVRSGARSVSRCHRWTLTLQDGADDLELPGTAVRAVLHRSSISRMFIRSRSRRWATDLCTTQRTSSRGREIRCRKAQALSGPGALPGPPEVRHQVADRVEFWSPTMQEVNASGNLESAGSLQCRRVSRLHQCAEATSPPGTAGPTPPSLQLPVP